MESSIQRRIKAQLTSLGALVVKVDASVAGWPDLVCIRKGRVTFLEIKRPGAGPMPIQLVMHSRIRTAGGRVFVLVGPQDTDYLDEIT